MVLAPVCCEWLDYSQVKYKSLVSGPCCMSVALPVDHNKELHMCVIFSSAGGSLCSECDCGVSVSGVHSREVD